MAERLMARIHDTDHVVKVELENDDRMVRLETWCGIRGWWSRSQVRLRDTPICWRCAQSLTDKASTKNAAGQRP